MGNDQLHSLATRFADDLNGVFLAIWRVEPFHLMPRKGKGAEREFIVSDRTLLTKKPLAKTLLYGKFEYTFSLDREEKYLSAKRRLSSFL